MEPSFPQARPDAVNVDTHQHPSHYDEEYNGAVRLFERELYEDSLRLFNTARAKQSNPHPYYAYYAACCHAKLNRVDHALDQLRLSILDGWNDFAHMQTDPDLSNLHKDERFAEISSGGFTEFKFEDLPVHHQIDIPGTKAVTLLALGAVVDNQPWEGWTSYISPTQLNVKVESDGEFKSGQMGRLKVKVNCKNKKSIAYMLVKDARLLSQDKPEARLAASIKEYVQGSSKELKLEFPSQTLAQVLPLLPHNTIYKRLAANAANDAWGAPAGGGWGAPAGGGWGAAPTDSWGGAAMDMDAMSGSSWSEEAEQMQTGMMLNRVSQSPPAPAPSAQPAQQASRELESRRAMMRNLEGGSDTRARSLQVSTPLGSSGGSYGSSAGMHEAIKAAFALAENPA
ncbi:MAG: hypothetical protein K2X97_16445, partial [Mycobacteriaceae bacterium]|nr:hypothetical protein [Mycobacteriaceae bacterium]